MSEQRAGDEERLYDLPFVGMAVTSPSSKRWLHANQRLCAMLGYAREELLEMTWAELTHPEDLSADVGLFERLLAGEIDRYQLEKRFVRKDGVVLHCALDVHAVREADGQVAQILAMITDVSARRAAEDARRESADLLSNLARQVPGVIYQFRLFPDGRSCFPFASEAITEIYEVTPEEVREDAAAVFSRIHPDDLAAVSASVDASAATLTPWRFEYRVVLPRQGLRWRAGHARPERLDDGSVLWHGFITDVTDQRDALAALEESEQRYRVQIEHAPEAIVVVDLDAGHFVDANRNAERMFGLDRASLLQSGPIGLSPPFQPDGRPSGEAAMAEIERALAGETPVFEWVHRDADGRDLPCEVRLVRMPSATRRLVRGSMTDIRDRKRAQEELVRLNAAIGSSISGVAVAGLDGRLVYVNRSFLDLWGYRDAVEVLGRHASEFWASPAVAHEVIRALRAEGCGSGEMTAVRVDGAERTFQFNANLFHGADGAPLGLMASFLDITESKRLQAQFLQSQKMQTVGRLAGGVAHDFNNLLTVMKGYVELAQMRLPATDPIAVDLAEVDRAIDSAAGLTQQLLAFSRKQAIHPRLLDLNASVTRVHAMLKRLLGEDVELRLTTAPDLGRVRFDPNQIEQVLVNLAVNARDAMPAGGRLVLETANVTLDGRYVDAHPDAAPGDYVMLAVSDNGTGMSDEVQSHLFEPFFTTKEAGRGTGLGLSMVYGAVTQNGGRIEVYSEIGHGSTFKVYLPRVPEAEPVKPAAALRALPRGTETIVVVEDEDAIRTLAVRVLTGLGYAVTAFRTGPAALRAIGAMPEAVDLVLTDVIMPEMNGREFADRVRALRPGTRILFASGYTEDVIVHHGVLSTDVDFLPKPYAMATLARRVRDALDRTAGE